MPRLLSWMTLLFCLPMSPALAIFSPAVSFYRTPQSQFPSGQASYEDLENNKKGVQTLNFYLVKKDQRQFRLPTAQTCRDLDLSFRVLNTTTSQTGRVRRFDSPWYEVVYDNGSTHWTASDQLAPLPDDLGLAQVFQTHAFRSSPHWKDENTNRTAPALEKYQILGFEDKFVKVRALSPPYAEGYLELANVILKLDFASFVLPRGGSWTAFSHREGSDVVLKNKKRLPLSKVASVLTQSELGILNQAGEGGVLMPRSTVEIVKGDWTEWGISELKGHGRVYWKRAQRNLAKASDDQVLTTEDVMGKDFFQVAVHPKKTEEALVSANGVFYTRDGKTWQQLPSFNQQNLPVAFDEEGSLLVGNFRSKDGGASFQPYLRWEDLTNLLEKRHNRTPGTLKISEIKTPTAGQIQITVDTGIWKSSLSGSSRYGLVTDWKVIKEN